MNETKTKTKTKAKAKTKDAVLKRVPLDLKILNCSIKRREKSLSTL